MRYPIFLAAGLMAATPAVAYDNLVLTVYTYDSFVSDWGPGPAVEAAFEETCGCDLQFVSAGDGAALLSRLRLEGERSEADVVLGLDTNLTAAAAETGLFAEHSVDASGLDLPFAWSDETFLPFDWGYFAFVHNTDLADVPSDFKALGASDTTIVIQDPRSSTPGLGLLLWIKQAYGDEAAAVWEALADNIVTVTPGWSEAYFGVFLEGEADMVLSYSTSPAYHLIAEEDTSKVAAAFDEGHYMQIEVAAKLAGSDQPDLADQFLAFMLTPEFQSVIPTGNWMYPVTDVNQPAEFKLLTLPGKALEFSAEDVAKQRRSWVREWQQALTK